MHKNASNHSSFVKWMLMKGPSAEIHKFSYFNQMLLYSIILSVLSSSFIWVKQLSISSSNQWWPSSNLSLAAVAVLSSPAHSCSSLLWEHQQASGRVVHAPSRDVWLQHFRQGTDAERSRVWVVFPIMVPAPRLARARGSLRPEARIRFHSQKSQRNPFEVEWFHPVLHAEWLANITINSVGLSQVQANGVQSYNISV